MSSSVPKPASPHGRWIVLMAALLGWLFDGFEMGLFPLVGGPALQDLLGVPSGSVEVSRWFSVIIALFLAGAATGGVLFGWMGDRLGRVRAMAFSILTYALFTGLCGFATEAWHLAVLRFIASLGMGGEWSLGVALVIEIWPERWRALLAGCIGAAANVGFLGVGLLSLVLGSFVESIESILVGLSMPETWIRGLMANSAWRFLMVLGALPAALVFFIRLFVPESKRWLEEKEKGAAQHWETSDLLGVLVGCAGSCAVIAVWSPLVDNPWVRALVSVAGIIAAFWGFMFPARQYLRRATKAGGISAADHTLILRRMLLGAGLAGVALLGTWGAVQWAPKWAAELAGSAQPFAKEYTQISIGAGAIIATILAALMGGWLGRRWTYMLLCLGTILAAQVFYLTNEAFGAAFLVTAFLLGGISASFYGFFPLYFPELFPTRVRATGQGFSFNFGRIVAAVGSLQTATLIGFFDGNFPKAGSVMCLIYVIGIALVWLGPETKGKPLAD